jgi:hypothetical protein
MKMMSLVSSEVVIDASKEQTWEVLADFTKVIDWNPFLSEAHALGDSLQGVGAGRSCATSAGGVIEEFVTDWPEGESVAWRVTGMPDSPPSVCLMSIGSAGDDEATLRFDFDFEGELSPEQQDEARQQMGPMVEGLTQAFKHFVETGERMQMAA